MDMMEMRFRMMAMLGGGSDLELVKTYTLTESWENDTKGNPIAVFGALFTTDERFAFNTNDYLVLVVRNNNAASYKGLWAVCCARDNYGGVARMHGNAYQFRSVANATSFWISSGATINVYKGNVSNLN